MNFAVVGNDTDFSLVWLNWVRRADLLKLTTTGGAGLIAGTGNGDPNDHTPDAYAARHAFSGRLAPIIRSAGKRGAVTATGVGLQPASTTVRFN